MSELDSIRSAVASAHGLDSRALPFMTGSTLSEIEAQAAGLAKVVGAHEAREPTDLLTSTRADQARRKQALLTALTGRREQPRDRRGRYGSFDGGARAPVPARGDPEAEHAALAADLIARSRQSRGAADVGRHF